MSRLATRSTGAAVTIAALFVVLAAACSDGTTRTLHASFTPTAIREAPDLVRLRSAWVEGDRLALDVAPATITGQ